jgi:hypothetical protein
MDRALQFADKLSDVRDNAGEFATKASKRLDNVRSGTADALRAAASTVRTTGRTGAAALDDLANVTANTLDAAGCFMKKQKLKSLAFGAKNTPIKLRRSFTKSPATWLIAATAVGFLAATAYRAFTTQSEQS